MSNIPPDDRETRKVMDDFALCCARDPKERGRC